MCYSLSRVWLCDPMDCKSTSVHGVLQTRILEGVAIPFSRESSPIFPHRSRLFYLFNLFIYFNWSIITLQYCFCHTSTLISHRYTCVLPILNIPLPPDPIPPGCHRALTLGALPHALNLHWSYLSHMIMYMFQCYFFKSSHPCRLPLSPKVCSSHLDWKLFSCHLLLIIV